MIFRGGNETATIFRERNLVVFFGNHLRVRDDSQLREKEKKRKKERKKQCFIP